MNQTSFEWYEFDVNVVCLLIATCTYKSNECGEYELHRVFNIVDSLIFKIKWALADLWLLP